MSMARTIRIQKLQNKNKMVGSAFNTLGKNQRRKSPWLGGYYYEDKPGREQKRLDYIKKWEEETERLLKLNPNLELVD